MFTFEPRKVKATAMPQPDAYGMYDPALLRAAKDIYSFYCQINPDRDRRRQPIGVAMNQHDYRGKLIFSSCPVLLPEECFVSVTQLETEMN
ncbi:hypothetical protein [Chamaesiphon sp.]|uniref:hypothetical protein n=1 Tax=Chamaesiphon sp. TaxID=2814140 RepID=UPI0035937B57